LSNNVTLDEVAISIVDLTLLVDVYPWLVIEMFALLFGKAILLLPPLGYKNILPRLWIDAFKP
jgi:hypothetical protein